MRRIEREGVADVETIKRKNKALFYPHSTPVWLVKALIEEYGEERALAILASLFERNKASIRDNLARKEELKDSYRQKDFFSSVCFG